jgi:hypothetical protein
MNDALQTTVDRNRIIDTIVSLFVHTDRRDWEAVKAVLAPQVIMDMTSMTGGEPDFLSPQEIADAWDEGLKPLKQIHHQVGNFLVDVREQDANAHCYGIASHYLPNPTQRDTRTFVGSYDLHLVRDGENWKIDKFKFNLKYIEGNVDLGAAH